MRGTPNGRVLAMVLAGVGMAAAVGPAGIAHADNTHGTWCPGQPLPQPNVMQLQPGGGYSAQPPLPPDVNWDMTVCHDWYRRTVDVGNGTLIMDIFEGTPPQVVCSPFWCPSPPLPIITRTPEPPPP